MAGAIDRESTRRSQRIPFGAGKITLNYYEAGTGSPEVGGGLPLIMLHGGGPGASSWSNFGPALPGFAASFRTLLIDQPGFGQSDKPTVIQAPMENAPTPTPGHWNINDIYRKGE